MTPAEQAAREIAKAWFPHEPNEAAALSIVAESIIQQAIDRSVAETEEKYRKLARKFRAEQAFCGKMADESSDAEHVRNLRAKEIHRGQAAYELESLIPKQEGEK